MTIASQTSRISYTGDGSTTAFAVPFYFSANADLVVYLQDTLGNQTLQVLGTNYNLTGATVTTGGTCTFTAAPTTGYLVSVYRDPPLTQTTSYNNNDPFPAKSHELALDKGTTIDQRTRDLVSRSVHISDGEAASTVTALGTIATRKNKLLGFGTNGELIYPLGPTFVGGTSIGAVFLDSQATAQVTTIVGSTNIIQTGGGAVSGDSSDSLYKRVVSLASGASGFQSGDGAWWQQIPHSKIEFDTRTSAAAAFIVSSQNIIRTGGYSSIGDGGAAIYKRAGGATTGGFVSADGAFWQVFPNANGVYTPEMFGAVGDGVTNDTTALQNCINVAPIGGTISNGNPTAHYLVSSTITVSQPVSMLFSTACAIIPTSALGSGDVMHFFGSANGLAYSTIIENIYVGNPGAATRFGGVGMRFDTTAATTYFRGLQLRNVTISAGTLGNYGLMLLNNATNNPNGGIYVSTIEGGVIQGGILVSGCGDNITFRDTLIPHTFSAGADNLGILVSLATGAGSFLIDHINFSQSGGIIMDACYASTIQNSQFEAQAVVTAAALVYIRAGAATITGFKFINNQAQANAGIGTPLLLNISSNVQHIVVEGNSFATPTSYTGVANASSALQLGPNFWQTAATHITGAAAANTYGGG